MSWEVLTMRSVTSFFNPALARSDLRRHWPILFLYTAIWLVALPVQLYLRHIAEGASYGTRTVSEVCQGTYSMGVIMAFVFGPHAAALRHSQQPQRRHDDHRDGHRQRRPAAGQRHGQRPEGHMLSPSPIMEYRLSTSGTPSSAAHSDSSTPAAKARTMKG